MTTAPGAMMRTSIRNLALAVASALALLGLMSERGAALDFQCIEPSRYKNLWQIFQDDPSTFFSYFNLSRRPLPPPEACRALLVTGTLDQDSANALLGRIIDNRGWLAALYLAFDGSNPEQEAAMATLVRQFSLKTYEVRGPSFFYAPDFVVRWTPAIGKGGFLSEAATADPSPLDGGTATFLNRSDRALKLDPKRYACAGGCRLVWAAGVTRSFNNRVGAVPGGGDTATERLRNVFSFRLDRGRLPAADDPLLARPWERLPSTPSAIAGMLRKECDAEMNVAETLESRFADAFAQAAAKKLPSTAIGSLAPQLNALKRAGVRLQQCLAAAHENHRLRAFEAQCPKSCNRPQLFDAAVKSSSGQLREAGTI